jgi:hypothetical protein
VNILFCFCYYTILYDENRHKWALPASALIKPKFRRTLFWTVDSCLYRWTFVPMFLRYYFLCTSFFIKKREKKKICTELCNLVNYKSITKREMVQNHHQKQVVNNHRTRTQNLQRGVWQKTVKRTSDVEYAFPMSLNPKRAISIPMRKSHDHHWWVIVVVRI